MMSSSELGLERHGRLSVFLGLVRLQALQNKYPECSPPELKKIAAAVSADYAAADWDSASPVSSVFSDIALQESPAAMRAFLDRILLYDRPLWLVACLRGRAAARDVMPSGVRQCLTFAQVFGKLPDDEAVRWWDTLVGSQRKAGDLVLKERGREAERLTLLYESERLRAIGIKDEPRWMALDDEALGYDVLTYDLNGAGQPENRMIEVKACSSRSLDVYISRGEWQLAASAKDAYRFHVWHLPTRHLSEFTVSDIEPHIPQDRGSGAWQNVRIPLAR